jgi:hypothetical protein
MLASQQKETYEGGRKMDKRSLLLFFLLTAHSLKRRDIQPNDIRHNDTQLGCIMTLSITTLTIMILDAYAEWHYADCLH